MKSLPTEFDAPEESPGFLLWQVAALWQRRQRAALLPLELTHAQFVLLASAAWLGRTGEAPTQAALAAQAKTDVMMTSQVLRTLEARGLLERAPHPRDTRAKCVNVTRAGLSLVKKALPLVEQVDREFFAALGKGVPQLTRMMQTLVAEG